MSLKNKHLVIIAPVHRWDDVRVFHKQAKSLKKAGLKVTLIARIESQTQVDGIDIVPATSSRKSRLLRLLQLPLVSVQALRLRGDVYHLHNPDTIIIGCILRVFGKSVIYDSHEDFAEKFKVRHWIPSVLRRPLIGLVKFAERLISRLAQLTVVTQQEVADRMDGKTIVVGNLPIFEPNQEDVVANIVKRENLNTENEGLDLRAVYIGYTNRSRGLFEMLDALERANKDYKIRLWLAGQADQSDLDRAQQHPAWQYVDYMSELPQIQAFALVSASDVGLVVLRSEGGHDRTDPNKIYEYMRFGIPFIASDFPFWTERFSSIESGFFVKPDGDSLAQALIYSCNHRAELVACGERGKAHIATQNWEQDFINLLREYKRVLS